MFKNLVYTFSKCTCRYNFFFIYYEGACYHVFPGASHNRFEHCIGWDDLWLVFQSIMHFATCVFLFQGYVGIGSLQQQQQQQQ